MRNEKPPAKVETQRSTVMHKGREYRVFTYGGHVVRIDSVNKTYGEKTVHRRIILNGRIATAVKRRMQPSP